MSYIKIRFGSEFDQSRSCGGSVSEMFTSVNPMFSVGQRRWNPSMDIYETEDHIIILAEIAGVEKENLELEISHKAIRIHGTRNCKISMSNTTYRLAEIFYGCFERVLFLPTTIDTEKVSASYTNGFLEINLTKKNSRNIHRVEIQSD
ncbi:Hsp20/alpha crystallin family protein [Desulfobotulus sp. H1]|uniref:Hsp20/alpha crystallin family protein n=1 Tax=Desulfobotulus pelophilus TaxID=2823377 RepID=A0ABT3NBW8_9BACT|nr:Hsp20/alpha crystallin family protein [Desulfobotulus pelophilus]MCW7754964.1 Hsp20/alpha crystallin family protein [Desulfobotulus pelophilus]